MGERYITQTFLCLAVLLMIIQSATAQQLKGESAVDLFYQNKPLQADDIVWSQFYDGDLYVLTTVKTLLKYSIDGTLLFSIQVNYPFGSPFEGHPISASCFQVTDTAIYFLNNHGLIVADKYANPRYTRPFGFMDCNGENVWFYNHSLPNFLIVPELDIAIHPVLPTFDEELKFPEYWYKGEVYEHQGHYNIYNLSNHLQQVDRESEDFFSRCDTTIGAFHPVYLHKQVQYIFGRNICVDVNGKRIWESQSASADIIGLSLTGEADMVFGEVGKHLSKDDTLRSVTYEEEIDGNARMQNCYLQALEVINPTYEQIYLDEKSGYMYRIYAAPIEDKVRIEELAKKDNPLYFLYYLNSLKKRYLQVYDPEHKLLSDSPIPSVFRILSVESGKMITLSATDYASPIKLVTYKAIN